MTLHAHLPSYVADPARSPFVLWAFKQLGNCIGRGQFGSVYRALNLNSGQMVAVKRIKLEGKSEEDVTQLMNEVDLLKSLAHPSVVKYEGLVRGPDVVSIILEYVENGSLLHTLKAFGNFPEKLVASYVVKILEGLNYLHDMKVVHCDLKAANILTTKNGNVKLSDFGVSLNLKAMEKIKNDAIGTPNWSEWLWLACIDPMVTLTDIPHFSLFISVAPEVIELKGASTAADIWSLACTIIELLTGKPPYGDMLAMSAMFRIVEDDCPPIPEKCSDELRDFLVQCFNKDPALRPSAEMLFEHEWLKQTWTGHKELRPQDSVPFLRRISADLRKLDPKTFAEPLTGSMERSNSTPPATISRPDISAMRASSGPSSWNTGVEPLSMVTPSLEVQSPPGSPISKGVLIGVDDALANFAASRRTSETGHSSFDHLRSPDLVGSPQERGATATPQNPSLLELGAPLVEEHKPHAFVKSTFSKAVQCKICKEPVKKHAVLCEECGLVCHARCTVHAPSPCNLRAQLLMYAHRTSIDVPRMTSPTPSLPASVSAPLASPTASPLLTPSAFKFGFSKSKKTPKQPAAESKPDASAAASQPTDGAGSGITLPPSPVVPQSSRMEDNTTPQSTATTAQHKRRISLRPLGRQRSASPSPELGRVASVNGSVGIAAGGNRRQSSLSYGSVSGSSTISSVSNGGGGIAKPSHPPGTRPHGRAGASTPHLTKRTSVDSDVEMTPFRRRFSSGFPFGHSEQALSISKRPSAGMVDANGTKDQGPVTPTPGTMERRKAKRFSSGNKADCTIM